MVGRMTYVDQDGETILETEEELREFARTSDCHRCRLEARFMLATFASMKPFVVVFSTTCEHKA
jgi:hypothetical protein